MKKLYNYAPMLVLTIFTSFVMVLVQLLFYGSTMIFNADYYAQAIGDSGSDKELYNEVNAYFSQLSKATGVPQEIYTKSLTKTEVSNAAKNLARGSLDYVFGTTSQKPTADYDYTAFEADVTNYIEEYSDANGIEKDKEYYTYIDKAITMSEKKMNSLFDVLLTKKIAESKVTAMTRRVVPSLGIITGVSIGGLAVLLFLLWFVDRKHPFDLFYWIGTVMFAGGGLLLIPSLYIRFTGYFDGLFLENKSVYYAITGSLYGITDRVLVVNAILCSLGFILIIIAQVIHNVRVKKAKRSFS